MAKSTFKLEKFTTPEGRAEMAFLNKPSTKFNADGVYSVKLVFDPDDMADQIAALEKMQEAKLEEVLRENPKLKKVIKKAPIFQPQLDDDGDETGKIVFNFKRNAKQKLKDGTLKTNKIVLCDTDGNRVREDVWSGSTLMVEYFVTPYFMEKDKEVGLSLKLMTAVVTDLVSGGDSDGPVDLSKRGFKKVEGFKTSKGAGASDDEEDDSNDSDASDDDNADF